MRVGLGPDDGKSATGLLVSHIFYPWPVLNRVDTLRPSLRENVMNQRIKRTQRDYTLAFKLGFIE